MNIHEYQAKALLRSYGAPVSDGRPVMRAEEAKTAAGELDGPLWVVKAQIHAGGRGKGGGVKLAKSLGVNPREFAAEIAELSRDQIEGIFWRNAATALGIGEAEGAAND